MLEKWEIIEPSVQLIQLFQIALVQNTENGFSPMAPTPKWLAPLVLLVDLYEKAAIASRRKAALAAVRIRCIRLSFVCFQTFSSKEKEAA